MLEIFQWKLDETVSTRDKMKLSEELADVFYYLLLLAHTHEIDLVDALKAKMKENSLKYPVDKAKGKANKYTDL